MPTNIQLSGEVKALTEKIENISSAQEAAYDTLTAKVETSIDEIKALLSSKAKDHIHTREARGYEPMDEAQLDPIDPVEFDQNNVILPRRGLENVNSPEFSEKAKALAFMEELVEIEIFPQPGRNPQNVFDIQVNGTAMVFRAGERKYVKRKFVEGLLRAKPVHYGNEEYVDKNDGIKKVKHPVSTSLRFPFSIIRDPSPKGDAWAKAVRSQP